ncbi:hypothetical protein C874_14760 [Elizabethkingia anophelis 502]|nr:hypothetical protein C874_14760 [Elizabethkingia anophelis 502]
MPVKSFGSICTSICGYISEQKNFGNSDITKVNNDIPYLVQEQLLSFWGRNIFNYIFNILKHKYLINMKKLFKLTAVLGFTLFSYVLIAQTSSDEKTDDLLKFKSENIVTNKVSQITTFTKDVSLDSPFISFNGADQVVYDLKNHKIEILNSKNFKVKKVSSVSKSMDNKENLITYYIKEDKLFM